MIDLMVSTKNLSKNEWLEFRKNGIGGSDVATICGLNRYKSPLQLWLEKTGQVEPEAAGEAAYWGNTMEPILRNEFTNRTGLHVDVINSILRHPKYKFMIANIDGIVIEKGNSKCIFEAKTASAYKSEQWENDKIPDSYMLQIQHYMAVTGFDKTYIVCLLGGNKFIYKIIDRDESIINMIIQLEYDFWKCVVGNVPPAIDGSDSCTELMSRLYPSANNSSIVLPNEAIDLIEQYNSSKEQEKQFAESKDEAANKLKALLGDNEIGTINDYTVSWKNVSSERLNTKKLKTDVPEIYNNYLEASATRRFTIK